MTAPSTLSLPRPTSEAVVLFSSVPISVVLSAALVGTVTVAGSECAETSGVDFINALVTGATEVVVTVTWPLDAEVDSEVPEETYPSGSDTVGFVVVAVVTTVVLVVGAILTVPGLVVVAAAYEGVTATDATTATHSDRRIATCSVSWDARRTMASVVCWTWGEDVCCTIPFLRNLSQRARAHGLNECCNATRVGCGLSNAPGGDSTGL